MMMAISPPPHPAVQLTALTKRYGAVTAVDDLDFTAHPGEVVALLGPNGAGKSTTLDMVLGLITPDQGSATLFGLPPGEAIRRGHVGALMQSGGLLPDLTAAETVALVASLYEQPIPVDEAIKRAGLTEFAGRRIAGLSGGEQQRVRFALALVCDPALLVLDEPTTGLDVESRRAFWTTMRQETSAGRTVLFATHYLDEADAYADRIVLMRAGKVIADGNAAQVKAAASGRTIRATLRGVGQTVLAALPGVESAEVRGDGILLQCSDADTALRALLDRTDARDVEVFSRGLEDAFLTLTSQEVTS